MFRPLCSRDAGVRYSFEMSENGFRVVFYRGNPLSFPGTDRVERGVSLKPGETDTTVYALSEPYGGLLIS